MLLGASFKAIHPPLRELAAEDSLIVLLPLIEQGQRDCHDARPPTLVANCHRDDFAPLGDKASEGICKALEVFVVGLQESDDILIVGDPQFLAGRGGEDLGDPEDAVADLALLNLDADVAIDNWQRFLAEGVVEDGENGDLDLLVGLPDDLHGGRDDEVRKRLDLFR